MKSGNYLVGIFGIALSAAMALGQPAKQIDNATAGQVRIVQPFTNLASIPASADPASIRFEKMRATKVPMEVRESSDASYCSHLADSGDSIYCPSQKYQSYVAAYEVTYSYLDPARDESVSSYSTFHVYLRPEEVTDALRERLTNKRLSASRARDYLHVSTFSEPARKVVVDEQKSNFCDGSFVDGVWSHTDAQCKDKLSYTTAMAQPDSLTVRVEALALPAVQAASRIGK